MKPTEESAEARGDFAGDESTSVMGVDLLSSLTERSRRIEVAAPPVPEPEISIFVEEPEPETEPVTTVSPMARPQLQVVAGEYPALGDEEPTAMMDEPEPTTVAIRSHRDRLPPPPPPVPPPAPSLAPPPLPAQSAPLPAQSAPLPAQSAPLPATSAPDPQWAADLAPRALPTIRVAPLPAPPLETTPTATAAAGSRRSIGLAAVALGVAVWTLGLGHHEILPASAISSPAPSVSSVLATPWGLQRQARATLDDVHAAVASLLQSSPSVAPTHHESPAPIDEPARR